MRDRIMVFCLISSFIAAAAFADEPGSWLLNYRESMNTFEKAFDKGLVSRIERTKDPLLRKGCAQKVSAECEDLRADYLDATKNYLVNALKQIDYALVAGQLAETQYRRDGKTVSTIEKIKAETSYDHDRIVKMKTLQDIAITYDPTRAKIITDEMLVNLHKSELGLDRELQSFTNVKFDISAQLLFMRYLRNGIKARLGIVREASKLGAIRTTMAMLCLKSGTPDKCISQEPSNLGPEILKPVDELSALGLPRQDAKPIGVSEDELGEARRHFGKRRSR